MNKTIKEEFNESGLTYADIAHELGTCELTARNKINGKTKLNRAEEKVILSLLNKEKEKK